VEGRPCAEPEGSFRRGGVTASGEDMGLAGIPPEGLVLPSLLSLPGRPRG